MSDQPSDGEQATAPQPSPTSTRRSGPARGSTSGPTPERAASTTEQPVTPDQPTEEPLGTEQPVAEQPTAADGTAEQPATADGTAEQPATEQPAELPKRAESPFGRPTATSEPAASTGLLQRLPARVTPGMLVAAVGALLTFLAAFLTWATADFMSRVGNLPPGGVVDSASGLTGNRLGKATLVLAIAMLILIALMRLPATNARAWIVLAAGGVLVVLLALLDLFAIVNDSDLPERLASVQGCGGVVQCTAERSAGIGVYVTILGGLIVLVGALMHAGVLGRLQERVRGSRSRRPA